MLNRVPPGKTARLLRRLHISPAYGVRVGALALAYDGMPFFAVWRQENALLARLESSFFLCGESSDPEELAAFLQFNPYFCRLRGEAGSVERVARRLELPHRVERFLLMACRSPVEAPTAPVERTADLRAVYAVMRAVAGEQFALPPFEAWYADMSHRIRHGCGRAYLLREADAPAAACMVSAEDETAGLLSGVATAPDFRRRGFASAVLARACGDLLEAGRLPVLECRRELAEYYALRGFEPVGEEAALQVETPGM